MKQSCLLLATLAKPALLIGETEASVAALAGPAVLVKADGDELSVENLAFRTNNGRITEIDVAESCR